MSIQEFATKVAGSILKYLPNEYLGAQIFITVPRDPRGRYLALCVRKKGQELWPCIDLDEKFEELRSGKPFDAVITGISETIQDMNHQMDTLTPEKGFLLCVSDFV